ncbi:MAG: DUF3142 domain-containing protein [Xanthomonadales bacterium]|nr:DUF3142 domain-containing protein [Xanthomonadales bacterium]
MSASLPTAALALAFALLGCEQPQPRWDEDVYVWQRVWSEPVLTAVRQASPYVDRFRILSAQWRQDDPPLVVDLAPGRDVFRARRIVPVARLDGSRLSAEPSAVAEVLTGQIQVFRAAGAQVNAVEIDHDTATAAVGDYARWLGELRRELPQDLALWITALPDWRHAPEIERLLDQVDHYTLQVHAVSGDPSGLMDGSDAEGWVRAFSEISQTPFSTALPTYQLRAGLDAAGEIQFLEAESPVPARAAEERWLFTAPQELVEWQWNIQLDQPKQMAGIAWYRLPIEGDRSVISMGTFQTILEGQFPESEIELALEPVREGGDTYDATVINHGPHDGAWPESIELPPGCQVGETVNGFVADRQGGRISHPQPGLLKAGESIAAGWVRCAETPDETTTDSAG